LTVVYLVLFGAILLAGMGVIVWAAVVFDRYVPREPRTETPTD
jgi:hypothetical protein